MTHTPGPWKLGSDHKLLIEGRETRKPIADVLSNFKPEEVKANARLIAAAPALLVAIKALHKEIGVCQGSEYDDSELAAQVIAAIAHAEGRA